MQYRTSSYAQNVFDTFYFEKNLQGDIIAVYNASGTVMVYYEYDAWGNFTYTFYNNGSSTPVVYNPFRYRGYYYDADLGLYYLNSRYYDSNTGRFINADGQLNGALIGYNQFAYCENNPIIRIDGDGNMWQFVPALDPRVYGGGGSGGRGAYSGTGYSNNYDSSAYDSYRIRIANAVGDASLGGYYFGGSSYIGGYTAQFATGGVVSVTDGMATTSGTSKRIPNPNGKKGSEAHQSTIAKISSLYLYNSKYQVAWEVYIKPPEDINHIDMLTLQ